MRREVAWRVFSGEYNDSTNIIKGEKMTPSYVITPLGAKINRMFIVGVLTDVESLDESGGLVRAHVSDPTGVFSLYSGQFQSEVTTSLLNIEVPSFVAVVGKVRIFEPEEGAIYLSIRPESVNKVGPDARDRWILDTAKRTKERIEAIREAMKLSQPNVYDLKRMGYSKELSEGVVRAIKTYQNVDLDKYTTIIVEALQHLIPEEKEEKEISMEETVEEKQVVKETTDEMENTIFDIIKEEEGENGALWDTVVEKCVQAGIEKEMVEETIASLMDKGLIYEPILGMLKTT